MASVQIIAGTTVPPIIQLAPRYRERLADPDLYRRDPAAFRTATEALARAQAALVETEERWLGLELLREELEA